MPDNLNDRGQADRIRINVHERHEVAYWTKALGCTKEELEAAVRQVGVMAKDVRTFLGKN